MLYPDIPIPVRDDPNENQTDTRPWAPLFLDGEAKFRERAWLMSPAEQTGLLYLLQNLRPKVAIEIGTRFGGSLQMISRFADRVYSMDIDPEVPNRMKGLFPNVEYFIGNSTETLPALVGRLEKEGAEVSFILVDGDHSANGVKQDIDNVLKIKPRVPLYIVMHDSMNPECRIGLRNADWERCPYVQEVQLDYIPGAVNAGRVYRGELWGGLALARLTPSPRVGPLKMTAESELTLKSLLPKINRAAIQKRIRNSINYRIRRLTGR